MPSSGQDVDLRDRSIEAWKKHAQSLGGTPPIARVLEIRVGIGAAIPNATTKLEDRGQAKICNVDPAILSNFGTWNSMKKKSSELLGAKQRIGQLVRNYDDPFAHLNYMYDNLHSDDFISFTWELFKTSLNLILSHLYLTGFFLVSWVIFFN